MKCVRNPFSRAWILKIPRISNERPSGAKRLAKIVRDQATNESFLTVTVAQALGQVRSILSDGSEIIPLNICTHSRVILSSKAHADQGKTIICHPTKRPTVETWMKLEALHLHTAPIGEIRSLQRFFRVVLRSLYGTSDR